MFLKENVMFYLDFAGAGILIGAIALAAALFYALPMKRKLDRLDRSIAQRKAQMRRDAENATRL